MNGGPNSPQAPTDAVTEALKEWRQGDCVVGAETFIHRFQRGSPLTEESRQVDDGENYYTESDVLGLVLVSQSCDIVRSAQGKPFVEVSPLVSVTDEVIGDVKKLRRPNYILVPSLQDSMLVGDLDRTMTVEKAVVAGWPRTQGCRTDEERARFAWALQRKRARFAFPNDFNEWVGPLQKRVIQKHDKDGPEGRALRAIDEIWVRAEPDWSANPTRLTFHFIRSPQDAMFEGKRWDAWLDEWLKLIPESGRFKRSGVVSTLDDLVARDLRESALLDLDFLSERE